MAAKSSTKTSTKPKRARTKAFTAEVSRLLDILVHSVYADRDVFLRELVSNAADACDRLRYEAVLAPELLAGDDELRITIIADKTAGTLTVEDNGIGMSGDEMAENLGTIARSGTRAFMQANETEGSGNAGSKAGDKAGDGASGKAPSGLIGQFGVGFYSAFIVAAEVEVLSVRAGSDEAWRWVSDGTGAYTVSPVKDRDSAPARGTRIVLKLREGDLGLTDPTRLGGIVRAHSDHIQFPIDIVAIADGERGERSRANSASALWTRPKSEVSAEQLNEFYGSLGGLFGEPALTLHYRAEGRHEYSVLLFVPGDRPFDLYEPSRKSGVRLYVRRVLIDPEAALLPPYLRFVTGVVDSEDMPLTISRDMLQENPVAAAIRKAVTNRVISTLTKTAEKEPESFAAIWKNFGAVLKEGLCEDYERRDELLGLLRFRSTAGEDLRSLKDYVADLQENQTAIYFITGDDPEKIAASPQLEGFVARGLEVLLLTDPVDSFWAQTVTGFDGKPFKSVTHGAADLGSIPLKGDAAGDESGDDSKGEDDGPRGADIAVALAFIKETLGEAISDVRASDRLLESPACLVAADGGFDRGMERIMRARGGGANAAPVLEINPGHGVVKALAAGLGGERREQAADAARMLFDSAKIADGEIPSDPKAFARRLDALLASSLNGN